MVTDDEILARLLFKLLNNKCFRKGHMLEERVVSSVPKHERGRAKDTLKEAVRKGLINVYGRTEHGLAYQINLEKLEEVKKIIEENYDKSDAMKI